MAGDLENSKVVKVTDDNFETTVLQSDRPFLLDMSAEWCGPCKAIGPVIEELANAYDGKAYLGTIDIDANPSVPTNYQVRSIPTLLMFKDGGVVGQLIGAHGREKIAGLIDQALE